MTNLTASTLSVFTVLPCRLAIGTTGVLWLASNDGPGSAVALVALILTILPARLIRESLLRDVTKALIASLLAAHIILGMQLDLYETSKLYDKAMHVIGSAAVAAILIMAVRNYCCRHHLELPLALFLLVVFTGTLSAGTLWEIFEFAMDHTGLFVAQRGLQDTMIDLLADVLGAILALSIFAATSYSTAV